MKFQLGTKVVSAKRNDNGKVDVVTEPAAGGAQTKVKIYHRIYKQLLS